MQGIAGDYFTLGLERFWIEANLPQKLLKKSSDKRGARPFQSAACANFAAEKSHARCGLLSDNLNVMEKRPIAQATRAEQGEKRLRYHFIRITFGVSLPCGTTSKEEQ